MRTGNIDVTTPPGPGIPAPVRLGTPAGRWTLVITAVGSGLVLLEATVVNVALPALERNLDASLAGLQWTVNAFTLTLSALILLGGGLGDRFGRRRVYLIGVAWFAAASLLCGVAPTLEWLIVGRALQGIGGALVVPGSLALIQSSFHPDDRARAIGWWSGMSGMAGAAGPLLGGVLVDVAGWRWVFLINVPVSALLAWMLVAHVPESRHSELSGRFDVAGAVLAALGLGAMTFALIRAVDDLGAAAFAALLALVASLAFVWIERRSRAPMLPLGLFSSRSFSVANLAGFFLYGGLAGLFFLLPIQLQVTAGYSTLATGLALLPLTVLTLVLSAWGGTLTTRTGPRIPLAAGALLCGLALLLATRIGPDAAYLSHVLPVVALVGLGIPMITPPITATVLGAVPDARAGTASAVSNGVARAAGLIVVAALPLLAGLPQEAANNPAALDRGFDAGMLICGGLFVLGGIIVWFGVPRYTSVPAEPICRHHWTGCPQLAESRRPSTGPAS
ncbi:DHA2 family efflux MFS transporter permease subunit [Nonomuraea deserti]|uniref:DHA2 family efflux MFS transporter permease subunit n=2 Tax=Nonomuraea deserti TaxID=1848322 RepID=A0A4R4V2F9_9ACTN|nr:DHA2 family efflux MFS transporter permease subunit [Nonomuraea deserti]